MMFRKSPTRAHERALRHASCPRAVLDALQTGVVRLRPEPLLVSVGKHVLVTITGARDPLRTYRSRHRALVVKLPFRYNPGMGGVDTPSPEFRLGGRSLHELGWDESEVVRVKAALRTACQAQSSCL
jgi:hypothetical protein